MDQRLCLLLIILIVLQVIGYTLENFFFACYNMSSLVSLFAHFDVNALMFSFASHNMHGLTGNWLYNWQWRLAESIRN